MNRSEELEEKIIELNKMLKKFPEGKLICAKNKGNYKWYISDGHLKKYIPKSERLLAEELALKKYISEQLKDIEREKLAINYYLRHFSPEDSKAQRLLEQKEEYRRLLSKYYRPLSQELDEWMNSEYESNPVRPEGLVHKSTFGNLVRSKSEAIIDMMLHINKIPFRYECALWLGETVYYPDFTIRHPKTGATYYFEHFGLMDDQRYARNAFDKMATYAAHGIMPSIQLIATFETREQPLSPELVEKIIKYYFM